MLKWGMEFNSEMGPGAKLSNENFPGHLGLTSTSSLFVTEIETGSEMQDFKPELFGASSIFGPAWPQCISERLRTETEKWIGSKTENNDCQHIVGL